MKYFCILKKYIFDVWDLLLSGEKNLCLPERFLSLFRFDEIKNYYLYFAKENLEIQTSYLCFREFFLSLNSFIEN